MIDLKQAIIIIIELLSEMEKKSNVKLILFNDEIRDFKYGWAFFYQSEEFVKTGDTANMLVGNTAIIVDKYTSAITYTGTSKTIDYYIEVYTKFRDDWYK